MNEFNNNNDKILVIGTGSIGKRHALNLQSNGKHVSIFDVDKEKARHLAATERFAIIEELTSQTMQQFETVFVCTPSQHHIKPTKLAIESGCHVFIEKPIAVKTSAELEEINQLAKESDKITFVGCNMRFHQAIQELKKVVDSKELGEIYSVHVYYGHFLPFWRAIDYRKTYSAKKELGGGMLLEGIHFFDYLYWIFGEIEEVYANTTKISKLEIDAEDLAEVTLKFKCGLIGQIHIDCLQKTKRHGYEVIGEEKTLIWESVGNSSGKSTLRILSNPHEPPKTKETIINTNTMYIEEINYFLDCIKNNQKTMNTIALGTKMLKIVEAAKLSALEKKSIKLDF